MAETLHINFDEDFHGSDKAHSRANFLSQKVEKILLVANVMLELPSAVFDQLSSVHKPQFALFSMLISFTVLIISIVDLVYKGKKQRVSWKKTGLIPWFYCSYPNSEPFGTFPDIVGIVCAVFQFIFLTTAYVFLSQNRDNPVKVSVWPIIFAFGLLYSGLLRDSPEKNLSANSRKMGRVERFTLAEISAATNDFSPQKVIGVGNFGTAYRGKLVDGREVVIRRAERDQQKESEFQAELEFLSRLHHKHLNSLVGYSEDGDERLLVYEYMKNGALASHLHDRNNHEKNRSMIDSWKMRIKIALDAARGIEYLHSYAVPPVIHRDIKSSNILLDSTWTARISWFGSSLKDIESKLDSSSRSPECYDQNVLTAKVDVYSFGVVLLELLTGKRPLFKNDHTLTSLVEFSVPKIVSGELVKALDRRLGPLKRNEAEAVEVMAYTALHCVNPEGENRPKMRDVVGNLEHSLSLLDASKIEQNQLELPTEIST